MRKYLMSAVVFVLAITSLSSCLGDGTEYEYSYDTAITGFTLGTLNRYFHKTKSDGTDSVYKRTLSCSSYVFYIDQAKSEIWNPDSLPIEIDPSAVICTVTTKNSGSVGIKSLTSDSLKSYSSSDSIDFTSPREFWVYNEYGNAYRRYTVRVNVHKEKGDSCQWTETLASESRLAALDNMKALCNNGKMYVFGGEGVSSHVYYTDITDGKNWTELTTSPALSVAAYKSIILKNGVFFCLSDGKLLTSVDAANWQTVAETDLRQLVAASSVRLYALSAEGMLVSSDNDGASWTEEQLDDDASKLPFESISYVCKPLKSNADTEKLVLIGNRSIESYPDDKTAMVWSKVEESGNGARNNKWNFVEFTSENNHKAPRAKNWQIVNYDENNIKAVCGAGEGECTTKALSQIYHSGDDGLTWRNDSVMVLPADVKTTNGALAMAVDTNNSVWIITGGVGQVWKGRINRLVWKKEQDSFFE